MKTEKVIDDNDLTASCSTCLRRTVLDIKRLRRAHPGQTAVVKTWCANCQQFTETELTIRATGLLGEVIH